jgi:mono/diheme cytochrome c family protein
VRWRAWLGWGLLGLVAVLLAIQLVPYGRAHANPPVTAEPPWDSAATRDLTARACFDCHSNETEWPWYSNIAPISWLTQRDVDEGRARLNFSEWQGATGATNEIPGVVREGEMPPVYYTWMHSSARLSDAETQALIQGLEATLAGG